VCYLDCVWDVLSGSACAVWLLFCLLACVLVSLTSTGVHTQFHVDGMPDDNNGLKRGQVHNFSILLGVLLTDLPEEKSGNLMVYPGGHRVVEAHCKRTTVDCFLCDGLHGLSLPQSVQITGKAGDIVLAHYNMPHSVAPNLSPHIRHCIYFRVACKDLVDGDFSALQNMWKHWQGVSDVLE
jgi:ectoine hydroxylase-related dioxygenase (phytanoyl-CoA dioxygenase family)